jgi:hypothetical protein
MRRALTAAVALVITLWADIAWSVPPDQIQNSPIPSLQAPARRVARRVPLEQQTPPAPEIPANGVLLAPTTALPTSGAVPSGQQPAAYPQAAPQNGETARYEQEPEEQADYDAQRQQIWNSPEMREARAMVMEYVRRSAQTTESEGRQFLLRLSQLSPNDMRSWLERYQQRRMRLAVQQSVGEAARQLAVEQAVSRQEATRQAFDNINQYQSAAAAWAQQKYATLGAASQLLRNQRTTQREVTLSAELEQDFDPFWPSFDPASPQGRRRYWAASASLPGDLPPGDPRNFIRGEEGIDIGANTSPQDAAAASRGGDPRSGPVPTGAAIEAAAGDGAASGGAEGQ